MNKEENYSPCPRCGSRKIVLCFDQQLFFVYCEDCGAQTYRYFDIEDAESEWESGLLNTED